MNIAETLQAPDTGLILQHADIYSEAWKQQWWNEVIARTGAVLHGLRRGLKTKPKSSPHPSSYEKACFVTEKPLLLTASKICRPGTRYYFCAGFPS
jgi:hypothetical protein